LSLSLGHPGAPQTAGAGLAAHRSCGAWVTSQGARVARIATAEAEAGDARLWGAPGGGCGWLCTLFAAGCSSRGAWSCRDLVHNNLPELCISLMLSSHSSSTAVCKTFFLMLFSTLETIIVFYCRFFWQRQEEKHTTPT